MKVLRSPAPTEPRERLDAVQRLVPSAVRPPADSDDIMSMVVPPLLGALAGIAILVAIGVSLVGQAGGLAAFGAALLGEHSAWYLSRASAFVAYMLLWWSMVLGLSITNRLARVWPGGPTAGDLHEHASLLGLGFGLLHALVLLGDTYIGYTLPQILIPFLGASYRPLWVGLGQVGLYLTALVTFSFYVRRWIGARTWRLLHYLSFAVFALALVHGLFSGTDSSVPWAFALYLGSAVSVLAMTIYRILAPRRPDAARPTAHQRAARGS
jgi:predicted ferric reductase